MDQAEMEAKLMHALCNEEAFNEYLMHFSPIPPQENPDMSLDEILFELEGVNHEPNLAFPSSDNTLMYEGFPDESWLDYYDPLLPNNQFDFGPPFGTERKVNPQYMHEPIITQPPQPSAPPQASNSTKNTGNANFNWISGATQAKKRRQVYNRKQIFELEKEYCFSRYLERQRRKELSKEIKLSERQVKIWFQNRRMKEKRQRLRTISVDES